MLEHAKKDTRSINPTPTGQELAEWAIGVDDARSLFVCTAPTMANDVVQLAKDIKLRNWTKPFAECADIAIKILQSAGKIQVCHGIRAKSLVLGCFSC